MQWSWMKKCYDRLGDKDRQAHEALAMINDNAAHAYKSARQIAHFPPSDWEF